MSTGARTPSRGPRRFILSGAGVPCLALLVAAALSGGCANSNIDSARSNYFLGRYDVAIESLTEQPGSDKDRVLHLMERGMMRQAAGQYTDSAHDWLDAHLLADRLEYFSVSKQSISMLINDSALAFRGMWYERALLHDFAAMSYYALSLWDDAAVEARNNIFRLERRDKFPDDPFSRYVNGFSLEMSGDSQAARVQYDLANTLLNDPVIDPASGRIASCAAAGGEAMPAELVCFIGIGRPSFAPGAGGDRWRWGTAPHARIYATDGTFLGRSLTLNTTDKLAAQTDDVHATRRAVKTATRIAIKEVAAEMVEQEDELAGELLRLLLFSLEQPDRRRWVTLPEWLQVVRVPCPADLNAFRVDYHGMDGRLVTKDVITQPITKRGNTYVSFCRVF